MANISTAKGTMYLSRKFYDKNKDLIDNWVKYYQTPQNYEYYGFAYMKIEEVTEDEVWLKLTAKDVGAGEILWKHSFLAMSLEVKSTLIEMI